MSFRWIDLTSLSFYLVTGTSATVVLFGILAGLSYLTEVHPETNAYAIGAIVVVALFLLAVAASWYVNELFIPSSLLKSVQEHLGLHLPS